MTSIDTESVFSPTANGPAPPDRTSSTAGDSFSDVLQTDATPDTSENVPSTENEENEQLPRDGKTDQQEQVNSPHTGKSISEAQAQEAIESDIPTGGEVTSNEQAGDRPTPSETQPINRPINESRNHSIEFSPLARIF